MERRDGKFVNYIGKVIASIGRYSCSSHLLFCLNETELKKKREL